jgi:hypothetical protein
MRLLPAPEYNADMGRMFWAIKDGGGNSTMLYKRTISAARMAMYEVKHPAHIGIIFRCRKYDVYNFPLNICHN